MRVEWLGKSTYTAEALLAATSSDKGEHDALDEAVQFLEMELLAGPQPRRIVVKNASEAGITMITLRRAGKKLGIVSKRDKYGPGAKYLWSLPEEAKMTFDRTPDEGMSNHAIRASRSGLSEPARSAEVSETPMHVHTREMSMHGEHEHAWSTEDGRERGEL